MEENKWLLEIERLRRIGVKISSFCNRRPVVKMEELPKIGIEKYFNDGMTDKKISHDYE